MGVIWKWICRIAYAVLNSIYKFTHKGNTIPDESFEGIMQFIKFGIVGLSNTVISYVLYTVSLLLFRKTGLFKNIDYLFAQLIGFVVSVLWSYYWNSRKVFKHQEGKTRSGIAALAKTFASYSITGLFLSSVLLVFWIKVVGISDFVAPIINLIITVPLNFVLNKFWAFREK